MRYRLQSTATAKVASFDMCLKKGVKFPNRYDVGHFMLHEPAFALSRKDIHKTVVATGSLICSLVKSRSIMV